LIKQQTVFLYQKRGTGFANFNLINKKNPFLGVILALNRIFGAKDDSPPSKISFKPVFRCVEIRDMYRFS